MDTLFGSSFLALYFIAALAVMSYDSEVFSVEKKVILLYTIGFACKILGKVSTLPAAALIITSLFFYLEYFVPDRMRHIFFDGLIQKIADYLYVVFSQYYLHYFLFVLCMLSNKVSEICKSCSLPLFLPHLIAAMFFLHACSRILSCPFKIKTIDAMFKTIADSCDIHQYAVTDNRKVLYDILVTIEDRTYFSRGEEYNFLSPVLWRDKLRRLHDRMQGKNALDYILAIKRRINRSILRGYSTIEMQLLRNVAIECGYDHHVIRRKFFEIIYTEIFFSALKKYYKTRGNMSMKHYRQYLLEVYFRVVPTKINGKTFIHFNDFFDNDNSDSWPPEQFFAACIGLSQRSVTTKRIMIYRDIIEKYNLSPDRILQYANSPHMEASSGPAFS